MKIEVIVSLGPRKVMTAHLVFKEQTSALAARNLALQQLGLSVDTFSEWRAAVWGKPVDSNTVLKNGDRLEVLRPLLVDPKEARRLRFNQQGSRAAGLFATRRQGAKAGY
jgi:putative ubiquitin-RnfH superfamily antitoxin RatB of RatAB toxin-antitoxin module